MKKFLALLVCVLGCSWLSAQDFTVGPAAVKSDGSFSIDGQNFSLWHYNPGWQLTRQSEKSITPAPGYPKMDKSSFVLHGQFKTWGGYFEFHEVISPNADGSGVEVSFAVAAIPGKKCYTKQLFLCATLPDEEFFGRPVGIGGEQLVFPDRFGTANLKKDIPSGTAIAWNKLSGAGAVSVVSDGTASIIDARNFVPEFQVRMMFDGVPEPGKAAKIKVKITGAVSGSVPLAIHGIVNRAFADDCQGDFKGGWTDQGPTNDLSMLPLGRQHWGGVDFDIIDPARNGGKSCLIMPQMCESGAVLKFEKPLNTRHFYLLHTMAWISKPNILVGTLAIRYTDGTETKYEVRSGYDSNDWWNPVNTDNGRVVWKYNKGRFNIGLTASDYPAEAKPIREVEFHSFKDACWMVVALSCGPRALPKALDFEPTVISASDAWRPMKFERDIVPGSALDFSFLLDAPAGKYGFVVNRDGRFSFENAPERTIRFQGTNFCMLASYPDKSVAELVASRLAAYGINAVRITHADGAMSDYKKWSYELNLDRMDNLDYFIYCLKQRGIYVTFDFFCSRPVRKGEIPGIAGKIDPWNGEFKALVLIDAEARKNYLLAVHHFMHHVNPYTKLAYKDEPAVFAAVEINEGNLDHWLKYANSNEVTKRYNAGFEAYLQKIGKTGAAGEEREKAHLRYVAEVHRKGYAEITAALRADGIRTMLFDQNMRNWPRTTYLRQDYDISDNHSYFDHPTGAMPSVLKNTSSLENFVSPVAFGASRIFGKPFMISEYSWCYPNCFRREAGILMGACGALQDWSGLFRYCYAHPLQSLTTDRNTIAFETNTDPVALLSDRISALLFVRGDVASARDRITLGVTPESLDSESPYPDELAQLCWLAKLGSVVGEKMPEGALDPLKPDFAGVFERFKNDGKALYSAKKKFLRSQTGEIEIDARNGEFKVVTPRTEVLMRNTPGRMAGTNFIAETEVVPAALAASSLDGRPLTESHWGVVFHLTNVLNDGDTFSDPSMRVYKTLGNLPHLLQYGRAAITVKMKSGMTPKVYALSFSGRRLKEIPSLCYPSGTVTFTADTACAEEGVMAYEIIGK